MSGKLDDCAEICDRLDAVIPNSDFPGGEGSTLANRGVEAFVRGDLNAARPLLYSAVEMYSDDLDLTGWPLPNDGLAAALAVLAMVEELMDRPEEARPLWERSIERSEALPYPIGPFSITFARCYEAWTAFLLGDADRCAQAALRTTAIAERHGFAEWQLMGAVHLTAGHLLSGQPRVVIDQLTPLLQMIEGLGAHSPLASFWATIAAAHLAVDEPEQAQLAIDHGERFVEATGHNLAVPALCGVQAQIADLMGDTDRATDAIERGVTSAVRNGNVVAERSLRLVAEKLDLVPRPQAVS